MAKKWRPGCADAPWKVVICAMEMERAEKFLFFLASILTENPQPRTVAGAAEIVSAFSGQQIADAVLSFHQSALTSVENALKGNN